MTEKEWISHLDIIVFDIIVEDFVQRSQVKFA